MKPMGWLAGAAALALLAGCGASASAGRTQTDAANGGSAAHDSSPAGGQPGSGGGQPGSGGGQAVPGGDTGLVVGSFIREGGPISPNGSMSPNRPLSGTVMFKAADHSRSVTVGRSGTFALWLPPGTYRVTGRTPSILQVSAFGARREIPCSRPKSVTVKPQGRLRILVACIVP